MLLSEYEYHILSTSSLHQLNLPECCTTSQHELHAAACCTICSLLLQDAARARYKSLHAACCIICSLLHQDAARACCITELLRDGLVSFYCDVPTPWSSNKDQQLHISPTAPRCHIEIASLQLRQLILHFKTNKYGRYNYTFLVRRLSLWHRVNIGRYDWSGRVHYTVTECIPRSILL